MGVCSVRTKENADIVLEYIKKGYTYREISNETGISIRTIRRLVEDLVERGDWKKRSRGEHGVNDEVVKKIKDLCSRGYLQKEIATVVGLSTPTVCKVMKKHGIKKCKEGNDMGESIESLFNSGMSADDIANRLGMSLSGVYSVLDSMTNNKHEISEDNEDYVVEDDCAEDFGNTSFYDTDEEPNESFEETMERSEKMQKPSVEKDMAGKVRDIFNCVIKTHGEALVDISERYNVSVKQYSELADSYMRVEKELASLVEIVEHIFGV